MPYAGSRPGSQALVQRSQIHEQRLLFLSFLRVSASGTVFVTAVGMFGKGHSGWGITTTPHSLGLVVGSMAWKPAVVGGRIEPCEILNLTVLFDHDVVDGAPATRFVRRLVELIESGSGLDETDGR